MEKDEGVYTVPYIRGEWLQMKKMDNCLLSDFNSENLLQRSDSNESEGSTASETDFRKLCQEVYHKLIHRKSSSQMYQRLQNNSFGKNHSGVLQNNIVQKNLISIMTRHKMSSFSKRNQALKKPRFYCSQMI